MTKQTYQPGRGPSTSADADHHLGLSDRRAQEEIARRNEHAQEEARKLRAARERDQVSAVSPGGPALERFRRGQRSLLLDR